MEFVNKKLGFYSIYRNIFTKISIKNLKERKNGKNGIIVKSYLITIYNWNQICN